MLIGAYSLAVCRGISSVFEDGSALQSIRICAMVIAITMILFVVIAVVCILASRFFDLEGRLESYLTLS